MDLGWSLHTRSLFLSKSDNEAGVGGGASGEEENRFGGVMHTPRQQKTLQALLPPKFLLQDAQHRLVRSFRRYLRCTFIHRACLSLSGRALYLPDKMAKVYDLAECKKHVSDKDCWLVVHGAAVCWLRSAAFGRRVGRLEGLWLPRGVDDDGRSAASTGFFAVAAAASFPLPSPLSPIARPPTGKVYDVTSFLEEHPGGYDVILTSSGERERGSAR